MDRDELEVLIVDGFVAAIEAFKKNDEVAMDEAIDRLATGVQNWRWPERGTDGLQARIAVLEGALKPFANAARRVDYYDTENYDAPLYATKSGHSMRELLNGIEGEPITVGDLRRAAQALNEGTTSGK